MNSFTKKGKVRHIGVAIALSLALTATSMSAFAAPSSEGTNSGTISAATTPSSKVAKATLTKVNVPGTVALGTAALNLKQYGYTETEYYATGKAKRYRGAEGVLTTAALIDSGHAYKTRVLVRKPAANKFNGTLIVEWTNVTIGVDADFVFAEAGSQFLRDGYAVAVVSAQNVGINTLKAWSPKRYGTLTATVDNIDPVGGKAIDSRSDALSWDIFSGVAAALENNTGTGAPLAGLKIKDMIAVGQSQSSSRLVDYFNTIQPRYNLFDGFIMWDGSRNALRSDIPAQAIKINSEGLEFYYGGVTFDGGDNTRNWDIPASTHGSKYAAAYVDAMFQRDKAVRGPSGVPMTFSDWINPSCSAFPVFSTVHNGQVIAAAAAALVNKFRNGTPLPANIRFSRDVTTKKILRDANGEALGGLRISQFVAPTATLSAFNNVNFPCNVSGSHIDLTSAQLKTKYGTVDNYVKLVTDADRALQEKGYLLKKDVDYNIENAKLIKLG